jgi:anti-anti-sigma regulatory factor
VDLTTGCQVRRRWTDSSHRVWLSGELASSDVRVLDALLSEVLASRPSRLTLDLSDLQFLGVRPAMVLIDAEQRFAAASKELRLGAVSSAAGRALALGRQLRTAAAIAA